MRSALEPRRSRTTRSTARSCSRGRGSRSRIRPGRAATCSLRCCVAPHGAIGLLRGTADAELYTAAVSHERARAGDRRCSRRRHDVRHVHPAQAWRISDRRPGCRRAWCRDRAEPRVLAGWPLAGGRRPSCADRPKPRLSICSTRRRSSGATRQAAGGPERIDFRVAIPTFTSNGRNVLVLEGFPDDPVKSVLLRVDARTGQIEGNAAAGRRRRARRAADSRRPARIRPEPRR